MSELDPGERKPSAEQTKAKAAAEARGEAIFGALDFIVKAAFTIVGVIGAILVVMSLSGVDMASADDHPVFRYRHYAAAALIAAILAFQFQRQRKRAREAAESARCSEAALAQKDFALSVDPDADRRAAHALANAKPAEKRGYAVELMALGFVGAGAVAFWHDHITHEIPNAVAVSGSFVRASCEAGGARRIGGSIGPHMLLVYEFPSLSTSARPATMTCLLDNCEAPKKPQYMDSEFNRVFYASLAACQAALPDVLSARAPVTVWTGDKDPNAAVRARFTPERDKPPYFLLWFPAAVSAVILLVSTLARRRAALS